jgi:hypothetical protein
MEKKVVVMSAQDVAEMRRAKKEAEIAYFDAKVGALEFAAKEMRDTNCKYTLSELSAMTGLSPQELVAQLTFHCKASAKAGIHCGEVRRFQQETIRHFVEMRPDGTVNPDSVLNVKTLQTSFFIPKPRNLR